MQNNVYKIFQGTDIQLCYLQFIGIKERKGQDY